MTPAVLNVLIRKWRKFAWNRS